MLSKALIKHVRSLELRKNRLAEGVFVAETPKVVGDLMEVMAPVRLVATEDWFSERGLEPGPMDAVATPGELARASFLKTPQRVLGIFPIPAPRLDPAALSGELCLALDGVQDPGNLGTMVRVADWFGISTVLCGEGTADAYGPKAVQATMGSLARVAIHRVDLGAVLGALPGGTPVYATALDGESIYGCDLEPRGVIVMGNEAGGVSEGVMSMATKRLLIPSFGKGGGADSLNVAIAAAVAIAEFRRRCL